MEDKKKQRFLFSKHPIFYPILAAVAAGTYPIIFYFSNNFTLANTWGHLRFFTFFYIVVPSVVFVLAVKISQAKIFSKWQKYVLPLLNLFTFFFLNGVVCLYAHQEKISSASSSFSNHFDPFSL